MHCPECGHANVQSAERCAACGVELTPAEACLHPGETRRDPDDDLSFPDESGPRDLGRTSVQHDPSLVEARRHRPLDAAPSMRDLATSLRPDAARVDRTTPVRYAGFFRRGVAFVIDLIVLAIFTVPLTIAGLLAVQSGLAIADLPRAFATDDMMAPIFAVGWSGMFVAYFTVLHAVTGQTIGKAALGIGVRSLDLRTIGTLRSFVRVVGYFASSAVFGLGFVMIALTPRHRGWHDYIAGTCVVRVLPKEV